MKKILLLIIALLIFFFGFLLVSKPASQSQPVSQLEISFQNRNYFATKGIYFGEDVESLGLVNNIQIYKRIGNDNPDSILLKTAEGQYQIYTIKKE